MPFLSHANGCHEDVYRRLAADVVSDLSPPGIRKSGFWIMSGTLRRNFGFNVVGSAIPIATSLIMVPLYLHAIGVARYGVVSITWLLLGYFGFLDFGLSRASANALSRLAHSPASERSPVLMTAFYLNLMLGLIAGLILYAGADLLMLHAFRMPRELQPEIGPTIPWIAAMLPLGMISGVASGALDSRERFFVSNSLSSVGAILGQALPLCCAYLIGPSLTVIIPATLLSRLLTVLLGFAVVVRLEWPLRLLDFSPVWVRRLFSYGAWVSVSSLISPILDSIDQILIGTVLGATSVARYAIPMNLSMRSQIIASALARSLFPSLSRVSAAEASVLMEDAMITLAYGFGMIIAPAIWLSGIFLRLWVGPGIALFSTPVAEVLLLGAWANGLAFLPYSLLQGQGRPRVTALIHLVEIVPFIIVLWLLMHRFGLIGAAFAWTARVLVDCFLMTLCTGSIRHIALRITPVVIVLVCDTVISLTTKPLLFGLVGAIASCVILGACSIVADKRAYLIFRRIVRL